MDVRASLRSVSSALDAGGVGYALIGGLAMAFHGAQRATSDLDFVLMAEQRAQAARILETLGYQETFQSENISHFSSQNPGWPRVDLLHALRPRTRAMIAAAHRECLPGGGSLPVVRVEDLIGLKIQAIANAPERALADWADIATLLAAAEDRAYSLDRAAIRDYLSVFGMQHRFASLFPEAQS